MSEQPTRIKGRGAASNPVGRFERTRGEIEDDGWWQELLPSRPQTHVIDETARSILSRNESPDIPFDQSINAYRGCEHGCVYCYARPTHEYLNLSSGLDFETRLFAKVNTMDLLRRELSKPGHEVSPINLGANTDPYQPIEKRYQLTRQILELLLETRHPLTIVTKNAMVLRDLDLLCDLAAQQLVQVFLSITTLDNTLASRLEPRASAPHARLRAVRELAQAGVPVGVFVAPLIPAITDHELEAVMGAAREAGASIISYTLVRLPHQVAPLFREWLQVHFPQRAEHVMSLIQQMRGGRDNDPRFGSRMRGEGQFAELLRQRFQLARKKFGFSSRDERPPLRCDLFQPPAKPKPASPQGDLFGG
jgi:DNA repair photolyase